MFKQNFLIFTAEKKKLCSLYGQVFVMLTGQESAVVDVSSLTNNELREELIKFGDNPGPVVGEYRHGHLKFRFNFSKARKTTEFYKMSRLVGKPTMWFSNRSGTNRPAQ